MWLTGRRWAQRWFVWVGVGMLLGVSFGVSLAALNTARRTASAYDRVLQKADAPDASILHRLSGDEAEVVFAEVDGIVDQRHIVGYFGAVEGVDPALTPGLVAAESARFPFERPVMHAGRLPRADRADEVVVNSFLADAAGLEVGQPLNVNVLQPPKFAAATTIPVTVVGIGTLPRDAVIDETAGNGVLVFSEAFADEHRSLAEYGATYVDLAPGVDARRDLAPTVGALGFEVQEAQDQQQQAVADALRPLLAILVAIGALAFVATVVAAAQLLQREYERFRTDDEHLYRLGMVRWQVVLARLVPATLSAGIAVPVALAVVALASPLAPAGPLHDLDPDQGIVVDPVIAFGGAMAIVVTMVGIATMVTLRRPDAAQTTPTRPTVLGWALKHPTARAGVALSFGRRESRRRTRRSLGLATVAVGLSALVVTLVTSATALVHSPDRYGFDWDLLAVNPGGEQGRAGLEDAFGTAPDVVDATGFTAWSLIIDGRSVPGLGATPIVGELGPTILEGRGVQGDRDLVVGRDTIERLGVEVGDTVRVEAPQFDGSPSPATSPFQIVGVATFPPVSQLGSDQPRLGIGALVSRQALDRLIGSRDNEPEWTAVRLTDTATPEDVIARLPDGIPDATSTPTSWYRDAKPAELRQLEEVRSLLFGAIAITALIAFAVVVHALWAQTRANRRDLAVLHAVGFTRRQRGIAAAWQAVPLGAITIVIGVPLGLAFGRVIFTWFARSLAVDDQASSPASVGGALVLGALAAAALGAIVAALVARRSRLVPYLRSE